MLVISLNAVSYTTPDGRALFTGLDLAFGRERVGLIGANGIGKTTLLNLVTGDLSPSSGTVQRDGTVGVLAQDLTPVPGATVADAFGVRDAMATLARALSGDGSLEDTANADWTLESRLEEALAKVGLDSLSPHHPLTQLSGGQRTRVALAALLFAEPDMLILDEPTNDLDAEGRAAIAAVLVSWRGGALVVSHDRTLLREMDRIVEISSLGVKSYGGNWDIYAERKAAERAAAEADLEHAEKELVQTRRKVQRTRERQEKRASQGRKARAKGDTPKILLNAMRNRAEGTTGKLAAAGTDRIGDASAAAQEARENVERLSAPRVELPGTGVPQGRTMLELIDVSVGRPGTPPLYCGFNLRVTGPERIALTGANGSGKTTLLHMIHGTLPVETGTLRRGGRSALLDQHVGMLEPDATIRDNFKRLNPETSETDCRAALARFLFRAETALRPVDELSGGERLRVGLACTLGAVNPPEILLLDEPTNHLDFQAIAAIEAGLSAYDGVLIVASHDPDFLDNIAVTRRIALPPDAGA